MIFNCPECSSRLVSSSDANSLFCSVCEVYYSIKIEFVKINDSNSRKSLSSKAD